MRGILHSRIWLVVAIAALLALVAVARFPTLLPVATSRSPLPEPEPAPSSLTPIAKTSLTILFVALGSGLGAIVILVFRAWPTRKSR